jgi:16S rRNA (guanine966-N2)-methyltransferase
VRIITGKFKGRSLVPVPQTGVRPATDRVKGTIFNMLQNRLRLTGAVVLDLFAGSGNLGLESLSRGAAWAVFVDDNHGVLSIVKQNTEKLGCSESCEIIQADALAYLGTTRAQFDLIFADPPYAYQETHSIPALVFQRGVIKPGGFLIIEHARRVQFEPSPLYRLEVQKEFGNTRVSFFVHPS